MKSKFYFTFIITFFSLQLSVGQTIIFEDDFDSYQNNDKIAKTAGGAWTTWSGVKGGAEDGNISTVNAVSGLNSLFISGTNDVLLKIPGGILTSGRYKINFKALIPEGKFGYFNILQKFNGSSSDWGTQTYFRSNGKATIDAGGQSSASFNQPNNEWFELTYVIDVDDDFATLYHNSNEIFSWKWSGGTFGSSSIKTLEAINFYAWNMEGIPELFIDDLIITKVDKGSSIITLKGAIDANKQIQLNWNEIVGADNYIITNKGNLVSSVNLNEYLITKPYPQEFEFLVGAHAPSNGYFFSNKLNLNLEGGKARDFVLFEVGTGTWCPNCPAAARGVDDMHSNGYKVGIIEYHGGGTDPYIVPEGVERINYYNLSGYPTTFCDGKLSVLGGSYAGNLFNTFKSNYDERIDYRSLFTLKTEVENISGRKYSVKISSEKLYDYYENPINLRIALTESNIDFPWQGLNKVDFLMLDMIPNSDGIEFIFNDQTENYETEFTLPEGSIKENCELVVFLQYDDTKEILNGDVIKLADIFTSTFNENLETISISPNPANSKIIINGVQDGIVYLINYSGQIVHNFNISSMSHSEIIPYIESGIYNLQIKRNQEIINRKILIQN